MLVALIAWDAVAAVPTCTGFTPQRTVCTVGGCTHTSLATAVSMAANNDVICVDGNTYNARLDVNGKKVTIVEGDAVTVIIENTGGGAEVVFLQNSGDLDLYGAIVDGDTSHRCIAASSAGSVVVLDGVTVQNCDDNVVGAAIHMAAGTTLTVRNGSNLVANGVGFDGPAIYATGATAVTVTDSSIQSNVGAFGGAIWANAGVVTLDGATFFGNDSSQQGGAVFVNGTAGLVVVDSVFDANDADIDGGAIFYNATGGFTVTGSEFLLNEADANNDGSGNGGAIYTAAALPVTDSTFEQNYGDDGGAIYANGVDLDLTRASFCRNDAGDDGGAINGSVLSSGSEWEATVFQDNTANGDGGAVRTTGVSSITVRNVAFLANDTLGNGDGWWSSNNSNATLSSSVIAFHTNTGVYKENGGGSISSDYNAWYTNGLDLENETKGVGELNATNPLFTSFTDDGLCNDTLTLQAGSALRNAGDPNVAFNDADASRNDIGPYGGPEAPDVDVDGDGYDTSTDCDDGDVDVYPGAPEVTADGVDQDCDGEEVCYVDGDGDSYGSNATVVSSSLTCAVAGVADDATDCDDGQPTVHPGAPEVPGNGRLDDCVPGELCYTDADDDGYGTAVTLPSIDLDCIDLNEAPATGDCDDAEDAAFPGGVELAGDGIDGDCNGTETCLTDVDDDGYGRLPTLQGDLLCSGVGMAPLSGDCGDTEPTQYPGAFEVVANGRDDDCDGQELCYADGDGDDYGTVTLASADLDCTDGNEAPDGGDCDDGAMGVYPGAPETVANGVDEDCSGGDTCWADFDGDGQAGGVVTVVSPDLSCAQAGEYDQVLDCVDDDDTIYDGAPETPADGVDQDCDGGETCWADVDLDGFGGAFQPSPDLSCAGAGEAGVGGDCDDTRDSVYPFAPETVADQRDQDCDGNELCYADGDDDTFGGSGTAESAVLSCLAPDVSPNNLDCDDTRGTVYPLAPELPSNNRDESCDGVELCWADADGDTYGSSTATVTSPDLACTAGGEANDALDCDDGDGSIHLGAAEVEVDGVDQDCDGEERCYDDQDGDGFGRSTFRDSTAFDCVAPDVSPTSDDCNDHPTQGGDEYPGAPEFPGNGVDEDCSGTDTVLCFEDLDGDGFGSTTVLLAADGDCVDAGESTSSTDCADDDDTRYPTAPEVRDDGIDQDCDGNDLVGCYVDDDDDGYGIAVVVDFSGDCGPAVGLADNAGDCDDDAPLTWPGAPDACGDGIDQDCDGDFDDDDDGLSFVTEDALGTDDCDPDSDDDTILDGTEVNFGANPTAADSDGDSLDDGAEWGGPFTPVDTDGDDLPDPIDTDDDGDLVPTSAEVGLGGGDWDGDGIDNRLDDDDDDDTIPTAMEDVDGDGDPRDDDTDADGDADWLDDDDDDDGVPTAYELPYGGHDTIDSDGDGVLDGDEFGPGVVAQDTDQDGQADPIDNDDDGDLILTAEEGTDDPDDDQVPNYVDDDSDGDGLSDLVEYPMGDSDLDTLPDWLDPDNDDGDAGDADHDGLTSGTERDVVGSSPGDSDTNDDVVPDGLEVGGDPESPLNTDGDPLEDWEDGDDDGDEVLTVAETGVTCPDPLVVPVIGFTAAGMHVDCDGDRSELPAQYLDTDADGTPDYLDPDDDDDGVPTIDEDPTGDHDGDGILDRVDVIPEDGPTGDMDGDGLLNDEEDGLGSDPYSDDTDHDGVLDPDELGDADQDGTPDFADEDDDGDGIPTAVEGTGDPDGDGEPNHLDLDSDADGIPDADEATGDGDCDGVWDRLDDREDPACDGSGGPAAGGADYTRQGCACSSAPTLPGAAFFALGLLLVRRRR